jgi:cyclopropane fatty-acyl-phospholipid synthase-like methyltransferase
MKRLLVRACNPLDYVVRRINGKQNLPPLDLRWDVGPLRSFEASAAEFRVYLKLFAGLTPSSHLLDIGCGCGQIALQLANMLNERGCYVGYDINRRAIAWCNEHIARRDRRFSFRHMDVRNGMYNPRGLTSAEDWTFHMDGRPFDVILLKSVFTHMLRREVVNYLRQIPLLLQAGGKCVATFFLLNDKQRTLADKNLVKFTAGADGASFTNPAIPESLVAFEEADVLDMIARAGLGLACPIEYGTWTGDASALSHQDILILEHTG